MLLVAYCLLINECCRLRRVRCLLLVVCCSLCDVRCWLLTVVVGCSLFGVRRCVSFVVCCVVGVV